MFLEHASSASKVGSKNRSYESRYQQFSPAIDYTRRQQGPGHMQTSQVGGNEAHLRHLHNCTTALLILPWLKAGLISTAEKKSEVEVTQPSTDWSQIGIPNKARPFFLTLELNKGLERA